MPAVDREGTRIHFSETGTGLPLVLLHGFLCSGDMWREQVPRLSQHGRVVNVDLRGHGHSGPVTGLIDLYDLVDDVVEMLNSLAIERAVWAGLSIGGMIALRAALRVPERVDALMLLDTHAGTETFFNRIKYTAMGRAARYLGIAPFVPIITRLMFGPTTRREKADLVAEWEERFRGVHLPSMLHYLRCLMHRDSVVDRLAKIEVPALVIVGQEDQTLPAKFSEEIASGLPQSQLVTVPAAGHVSALEQPRFVTDEMCRFIQALR